MLAYGGCLSLSFSHTLSILCLCYVFFRGVGDAAKMPPLPCILKHVFLSGGNLCWWNVMYMLMAHVLPWLFDSVLGSSSSSSSFPLLLFWLMLLFFCCFIALLLLAHCPVAARYHYSQQPAHKRGPVNWKRETFPMGSSFLLFCSLCLCIRKIRAHTRKISVVVVVVAAAEAHSLVLPPCAFLPFHWNIRRRRCCHFHCHLRASVARCVLETAATLAHMIFLFHCCWFSFEILLYCIQMLRDQNRLFNGLNDDFILSSFWFFLLLLWVQSQTFVLLILQVCFYNRLCECVAGISLMIVYLFEFRIRVSFRLRSRRATVFLSPCFSFIPFGVQWTKNDVHNVSIYEVISRCVREWLRS